MARILGTPRPDVLEGTRFDDLIRGFADNDTLFGRLGNDRLNGGHGNDFLWGNEGDDTLIGAKGDDEINGGAGADTIFGGGGNDTIAGGLLNDEDGSSFGYWDTIWAGAGDDRVDINQGWAFGAEGDDRIASNLMGASYVIQVGGSGADDFAAGFSINDGALGLLHVADFAPAEGDRIGIGMIDYNTGIGGGGLDLFNLLDSNDDGLVNDADDAAVAQGNRLWLVLNEDLAAIDFTGGQPPALQADWILA